MLSGSVREVLVVELLGGFGDLLLALPAVHALARSFPSARVTVLTFAPGDVLLRTDPHVRETVVLRDHGEGAARAAVRRELSRRAYDLVVTTTTYDGIGALCAAGAPRAVTDLWRRPPADERVDRRFLRLLAEAGVIEDSYVDAPPRVHLSGAELAEGEAVVAGLLPAGAVTATEAPVVLVPEAGMPVKRWPQSRWAALAHALGAAGVPVLAVGTDGPGVPGAARLPAGDLRALAARYAAVGRRGGVVVGSDTGPVRLATAAGARAVGLYGPTVAGRYGLDPAYGVDLQGLPGCEIRLPHAFPDQECWWSGRCPLSGGEAACMADLAVSDVLAVVQGQRGHGSRGRAQPALPR